MGGMNEYDPWKEEKVNDGRSKDVKDQDLHGMIEGP